MVQLSGFVGHVDDECVVASAFVETSSDHTAEGVDVDISARHKADSLEAFYGHFVEHCSCHSHCAGAFCHEFLLLDECEDCGGDFVVAHCHDFVDVFIAHLEGVDTGLFHGDAVGDGRHVVEVAQLAFLERCRHRRCAGALHAVYFHVGAQGLDGECHTRYETAAAYGHDHGLHVGHLLENLEAYGALAGNHLGVVEGVDEAVAEFFL